jgi:ligand-binding SRPBCC domain-containing protein
MTTIQNEITINAPIEKIWQALTEIDWLEKYDPTVKKSIALTRVKNGIGAKRKVEMLDGKNWFEEQCTIHQPTVALTYKLTSCSFPVHRLKHSYSFEHVGIKLK